MTKLILILAVCVSFGAGLLVGLESRTASVARPIDRDPHGGPPPRGDGGGPTSRRGGDGMQSYLAARLKLTPDQQTKIKEIWETTMRDGMRQHDEKRKALRKDRDDAIVGLIAPERKSEYDAVLQRYSDGQTALEKEMRDNFDAAVKQTNDILDPEQQAEYNKFREERQRRQPPDGGRPGEGWT